MTLTKDDIADSIYNQCGFSKAKSDKLLETLLAPVASHIKLTEGGIFLSRCFV